MRNRQGENIGRKERKIVKKEESREKKREMRDSSVSETRGR